MFRYYQPMTTWDVVRPSYWYPMASLEQSLMDLDALADDMRMSWPLRSSRLLVVPSSTDDDDFFKDLPVASRETQASKEVSSGGGESTNEPSRAFSNYSYSSSSVVDDQGRRVQSIRRRYEDANGCLKAIHERHLPGKTMVTTWRKKDNDDKGNEETTCTEGVTKEEFEKEWKKTPFAKAHESAKPLESDKTKSLESGHTGKSEGGESSKASTGSGHQQAKEQVTA
ncbi:hypothetical protein, variant 2 [Aphanomyces invadans]|uniref:Uncharacterized protein n=1 Tax=Aphanomyces invadans TaxID=157072 RepID=A0A024UDC2_9STRA|nr:hypothetical protein H310_04556 [Aphanomyces invadans]XP_008867171.1 hypothetical protein, variant 1 [Aphanomyces invadans]XP_008867172.1 hypothetical protein, variant 2 [Aphanomyces invadans]ETW04214.1 hypothetical protein H310_04556 [Aphanomyces invadans]ETW04215.1 hypothetical protein, variant 1 [Aphanomyces invadans]ETW04216.1 hypothetical protein, variant 2 [Aphanomyces invadans]|eukprot:XP_008867170.1 hypothetical protein H310_04556 [Aphanomyces invadans]